jgi:hypothetical protein
VIIERGGRRDVGARLDDTDSRDELRYKAQMPDRFAPPRISPCKIALFD